MTTTLTNQTFDEFIANDGAVIVDFWAEWCGPCRQVAPLLEEISAERSDVAIGKVDVDVFGDLAARYNVQSIPTLLFFKDGELKSTQVGAKSKTALLSDLEVLLA